MGVEQINKYVYNGKEYSSLADIRDYLHNRIGEELLHKMTYECPLEKHKDYDKLLSLICSRSIRDMLVECLSVRYSYTDEDTEECVVINVLDV